MAISEFVGYLRCQACDQKGFEGRTRIEETSCLMEHGELVNATIWWWKCKFCGSENKFIHTV